MAALMQPVPARGELEARGRRLRGRRHARPRTSSATWLVDHGYKRVEAVELPGEFARRGGILDVFSPDAEDPVRLEFFGDEVESIRPFAAETQRSLGELNGRCQVLGQRRNAASGRHAGHLGDYLPAGAWIVLVEPDELHEQGKHYLEAGRRRSRGCSPSRASFQQLLRPAERHRLGAAAAGRRGGVLTCASSRSSGSAATSTGCATSSTPSAGTTAC